MNIYLLVLFFHIMGAIGMFIGLGMEGIILKHLSRASTNAQLLSWKDSMKILRIVFSSAAILLLLPGIYMVIETWGWTAWVIVGLLLLIALSGFGNMAGKRIVGMLQSLNENNESISAEIKEKLSATLLLKSFKIRVMIAIGIIFIMTLKTGWIGSIVTILFAFLVGFLISILSKAKDTAKELESAKEY